MNISSFVRLTLRVLLMMAPIASAARAGVLTPADIAAALTFAEQRAAATVAAMAGNTSTYPRSSGTTGSWTRFVGAGDWTSGFWPWELTSLYRATGDHTWLNAAVAWTTPLYGQAADPGFADTGMQMQSVGALYSLTGNPTYKSLLLQEASSLATRYNPVVKAIDHSSDKPPGSFFLLEDTMNDLRPLMWAGANGGDPAWLADAVQHGLTTAANLLRADGSTFQRALFDPVTGQRTLLGTYQGYSDTSDWQRGLTWAMNGYADLYNQTGNPAFLQTAEQLADHFTNVLRNDCVPYWDAADPSIPNAAIDTSAAALGDLALTKLAVLATTPNDRNRYETAAQCGLKSLIASDLVASSGNAILKHGNNVGGRDGADTSLIFGDAAFVAALVAQQNLNDGQSIGWVMSYDLAPISAADVAVIEPGMSAAWALALTALSGIRRRARSKAANEFH